MAISTRINVNVAAEMEIGALSKGAKKHLYNMDLELLNLNLSVYTLHGVEEGYSIFIIRKGMEIVAFDITQGTEWAPRAVEIEQSLKGLESDKLALTLRTGALGGDIENIIWQSQ